LTKGETISGLLRKPPRDYERILRDAGMAAADIRFSKELAGASLSEDEFEAFVQEGVKAGRRADKATRRKSLRKILSGRLAR